MGENTAHTNGVDGNMDKSNDHASGPGLHGTYSQADGDISRDIAICGFSVKFPQEATSSEAFWEMMLRKRCAMSDFPADYMNPDGFYEGERNKPKLNSLSNKGGHFISEDLDLFDAEFFSISPAEAASMDPMQRWLLETSYRALENAGMTMESVSGTSTGIYTGTFAFDYMLQLVRDPECPPLYASQGFGLCMLSNRLSWFFNLRGPSMTVDTACSSAATAIDVACQALINGSCDMAMAAGCTLARSPESYIWLDTSKFLSADSRCFSFDHRANGYARGEGIAVMVLKRVADAVRDGDTIRAVIRSVRSNEDGKTPGITQPSREAQQELISRTYAEAGLSKSHTRFFEAHGTGTKIGDPREAKAIGLSFRGNRSDQDPLYVGAVKSNIGHLEGASGLAGVLKTVMVLEKGIIPSNCNLEKLNPRIDADFLRLKFPQENHPWPTVGLRRASVNSFGFGGSNTHIVIDDAYNYLKLRSLPGRHCTAPYPPPSASLRNSDLIERELVEFRNEDAVPHLLVWSAADKPGLARIKQSYRDWIDCQGNGKATVTNPESFMASLSFTLDSHRNLLPWRSFAVLRSPAELTELETRMSVPLRASSRVPRLGFVFSGQGGQWFAMGRELLRYPSYRKSILAAGDYLQSLGCPWSPIGKFPTGPRLLGQARTSTHANLAARLQGELCRSESESNLDKPDFGQPLSTILQVAIVDLLKQFGVHPSAVVGHSSGEVAAAYAGGYLDCQSAWRLAYFRGRLSADLAHSERDKSVRGAMISVGLSEEGAKKVISPLSQEAGDFGISIACINSPSNVTVSGEAHLIEKLRLQLEEHDVFVRKLRVPLAYHSPQMETILDEYVSLIGSLSSPCGQDGATRPPMLSTVLGQQIDAARLLNPLHWVDSTVKPVQFSRALLAMCVQSHAGLVKKIDRSHLKVPVVDHLLEIGPHSTLKGPIREILRFSPRETPVGYSTVLTRGKPAVDSMLQGLGELFSLGFPVKLRSANDPEENTSHQALLVDLPEYPFDRSQRYWHESRLSRNYRLRGKPPSELLGVRARDWNPSHARWRHFMRLAEIPWAEHHVVNGSIIYPGTGMLAMAVEAARQLATQEHGRIVESYTLRDVHFETAIDLSASSGITEVQTSLRRTGSPQQDLLDFEFSILMHKGKDWIENCHGFISVEVSHSPKDWATEKLRTQREKIARKLSDMFIDCRKSVPTLKMYLFLRECGYHYGQYFQLAQNQRCNNEERKATASVDLSSASEEDHVFHPTSLDAILHLCFTAFSAGGTAPMATSIPSRIRCIWISNEGLQRRPGRENVTACTSITNLTSRGFECSGGALGADDAKTLRLWYDGLELTSVTHTPHWLSLPNPKQWYMNVDNKLALQILSNSEVYSILETLHPPSHDQSGFFADIQQLVEQALERLTESIDSFQIGTQTLWQERYWHWAQYHLKDCRRDRQNETQALPEHATTEEFRELAARLKKANPIGRVFSEVADNLVSIFKKEVDPLQSLVHSDLLKDYYREMSGYRCAKQAASYVDLLAHQIPGLKILEIGGGTGSATRNLVSALRSEPKRKFGSGSLRVARYDFTDISLSFTEKTAEEFSGYKSQMTFSALDIEQDLESQGFKAGDYDVVVADNVLHATADLAKTLRNVRRALKPGGRLIMQEPLKASGWTLGFVFGVFPGWWAGAEDGRVLSPAIDAPSWDKILRSNGFSGTDILLKDFDQDVAHNVGWLVSTATERHESHTNMTVDRLHVEHRFKIVVNRECAAQLQLAEGLLEVLHDATMEGIEAAAEMGPELANEFIIMLADCGLPFLKTLNEEAYDCLKAIVSGSRHLLWVSGSGYWHLSPDYGILDGLARTLRAEYYELHLVTLVLDLTNSRIDKIPLIQKILEEMLSRTGRQAYEQDYFEIDGRLHTRRLVEAGELRSTMQTKLVPHETMSMILDGQRHIELKAMGFDASAPACFVLSEASADSGSDVSCAANVEISIRAASLQFQDRARALGQNKQPHTEGYSYCAGFVVGSGSCSDPNATLQPGHRVLAAYSGPLRSHICVPSIQVVGIPDALSFSDACASAPFTVTAFQALVELGKVGLHDSVLVCNGASATGQAALRLLCARGVPDVWTTASGKDEASLISRDLGVEEGRILPHTWFESQPMLLEQRDFKFDVAISFVDQESSGPRLTNHLKSGGRYILVRTGNVPRSNTHSIQSSPPNITVASLHMGQAPHNRSAASLQSLRHAVNQASHVKIEERRLPVQHFKAADIGDALKHLNRVSKDTLVIEFDKSSSVNVVSMSKSTYHLDPDGSYLIAGGLGGVGRSVARWLVDHGARHLILLSRSGPKSSPAQQLLVELREKGVHVETPRCDISDEEALGYALANCAATMPPVKGCIQSCMVITEGLFGNMPFQGWKSCLEPKVQGSWYLHTLLPRDLDFFILISSMMGTIGGASLSAYSAANAYMDALARHRVSNGERGAALGLGVIVDSGFLIEDSTRLTGVEGVEKYAFTREKEIFALLEIYCNPSEFNEFPRDVVACQPVTGIRPPAHWQHLEDVAATFQQPYWGHMHHVPALVLEDGGKATDDAEAVRVRRTRALGVAERLAAADSLAEAGQIATEALAQRVSVVLGTAEDRLDVNNPMHSYGIDSLSALDVRNWVGHFFDVDLPVFEILGGATLASAGLTIAKKFQLKT